VRVGAALCGIGSNSCSITVGRNSVQAQHLGKARGSRGAYYCADVAIGDIERFLQEMITNLTPKAAPRPGPGRPQVLPGLCLWVGLLVCVLRGFASQLALWRLLALKGLWAYPRLALSDQALYKRLDREAPLAAIANARAPGVERALRPLPRRRWPWT